MKKMIKVWTQVNGKAVQATLPVINILKNSQGVRLDGIIDAVRYAVLDAHAKIEEIEALLLSIAQQAGNAAGEKSKEEKKSLRPQTILPTLDQK